MRAFVRDDEGYDDNPVETVNTNLFTICVKEFEKDLFLCLVLSHENLYTDHESKYEKTAISCFEPTHSLFREEDTHIFTDTLKLYYDLFWLFHHSLQGKPLKYIYTATYFFEFHRKFVDR